MEPCKAVFFCDGSARPNPGYGGYGIFGYTYKNAERSKNIKHPVHGTLFFTPGGVLKEKGEQPIEVLRVVEIAHALSNPSSTNNLAELLALHTALTRASEVEGIDEVTVFTDSTYTIDSYTKDIDKWKVNGWKTQTGKDVSNMAVMLKLDNVKTKLKELDIKVNVNWVKGHDESHGNTMADLFSVAASNSAKRQLLAGGEFNPIVYDSNLAYGDYKKSYAERDILFFFRDLYFSSAPVDDANYCFLSLSDNPNNKGKRDTSSIFMTNIGYVPPMIQKFKEMFRDITRNYVTTCCIKLSKLENKELMRLCLLVNIEDLLVKSVNNNKVASYTFIRDTQEFMFETNHEYPFMIDASRLFSRSLDVANEENKLDNPNFVVRDITDLIVKDKKLVITNKDKSVDFTDVIGDAVQLKQKLLMTIGHDIPTYLALKNIEEDIQQVHLILESKPNNNYCTLFVNIVMSDRTMYSVNIENKYLRTNTHVV